MKKMRMAMVSLAIVGFLVGQLASTANAKNNVHVNNFKTSGTEDEGRVVYADMKMAVTSASASEGPAPAPSPSSTDDTNN
uniref:Uncharacterized protein n=1 Tax=Leersia perrieri TaxID=77586 RepID=A0A0D9WKN3_9ORYZ